MLFISKAQFAQFIVIQKSFCKENEAVLRGLNRTVTTQCSVSAKNGERCRLKLTCSKHLFRCLNLNQITLAG